MAKRWHHLRHSRDQRAEGRVCLELRAGHPQKLFAYRVQTQAQIDRRGRSLIREVVAEDRRTLLKVLTGVVGGGTAAVVGGPALTALLSPWGKKTVSGVGEFVPVARAEAVPEDGTPLNVPVVIQAPKDAWTALPPTTVGAVYLCKRGGKLRAYSTICPHLGCGIDYVSDSKRFSCPCHESFFGLDGQVASGPSPRGMDELELREVEGRVEVRFLKFKIGQKEKVPT